MNTGANECVSGVFTVCFCCPQVAKGSSNAGLGLWAVGHAVCICVCTPSHYLSSIVIALMMILLWGSFSPQWNVDIKAMNMDQDQNVFLRGEAVWGCGSRAAPVCHTGSSAVLLLSLSNCHLCLRCYLFLVTNTKAFHGTACWASYSLCLKYILQC